MTAKRYRRVVLSPHLDDAVFSCGALIAEAAPEVLVINVFTRFPPPSRKQAFVALSDERKAEEAEAAGLLGFDSVCLDEVDAWLRHPLYERPSGLFGAPASDDPLRFDQLLERVKTMLGSISFDELYAPLGVGWHVDHLLTYRLAQQLKVARPSTPLWLYEDVPYAGLPGLVEARLAELKREPPGALKPLARSAAVSLAQWPLFDRYRRWVPRFALRAVLTKFIAGVLTRRHEPSPSLGGDVMLVDGHSSLTKKLTAMQAYRSQFGSFFRDGADAEQQLRQVSARHGTSDERQISERSHQG